MKYRKNFLPHIIPDIFATLFLTTCVPITFWFQMFVVLPEFHAIGSFVYTLTLIGGIFLLFNIQANILAIMLTDTSIKGKILVPPTDRELRKLWRMCAICESLAPPRSWHCTICKTCILKRDHHCVFTGYCIGHLNYRFFIMLLIFLIIGTTYSSIYNTIFIWWYHANEFCNYKSIIKMIFPIFMLFFDVNSKNYYLTIYELNCIGSAFTIMLILYHRKIFTNGTVIYERNSRSIYDLGLKKNIEMVLGKRWYIAWISPFINSPLPHDGIHWESILDDSVKNR